MALVVKITGGPTLFDATVVASVTPGMYDVVGTAYPDEHPMFEHGNSAVFDARWGDTTGIYPQGYTWSATVPGYKIQEAVDDSGVYQLEPVAPVEDQRSEQGGSFDPGGTDTP